MSSSWTAILLLSCSPIVVQETTLSPAKPVDVILTRYDRVGSFSVLSEGNLRIHSGRERAWAVPSGASFRVRSTNGGIQIRDRVIAGNKVTITPEKKGSFKIGDRGYRGSLVIEKTSAGKLRAVNRLPMEEYLRGVVSAEMPTHFPKEALAAQAIAARSYAYAELQTRGNRLVDSVLSQVYRGRQGETPRTDEAIRRTAGMVLTYRGKPFPTYFHSTCGGHTGDPLPILGEKTFPPLRGSPCGFCSPETSKYFEWKAEIPLRILNDLVREKKLGTRLKAFGPGTRDPWGRWTKVRLVGDRNEAFMRGDLFRMAVNLAMKGSSNLRSLQINSHRFGEGKLYVEGNGWGHGVGMCQIGAMAMGKLGMSYQQILARYYPGATIQVLGR